MKVWGGWDLNPRPKDYESSALTTELPPCDAARMLSSNLDERCKPDSTRATNLSERAVSIPSLAASLATWWSILIFILVTIVVLVVLVLLIRLGMSSLAFG